MIQKMKESDVRNLMEFKRIDEKKGELKWKGDQESSGANYGSATSCYFGIGR